MQAQSLTHVDTGYSADCIEWCPHPGYEDIFVCGTYQVIDPTTSTSSGDGMTTDGARSAEDDDDQQTSSQGETSGSAGSSTQRTGRLLVYQVDADQKSLTEIQRIETNAILDAKWSPYTGEAPTLVTADAKGKLDVYRLSEEKRFEHVQGIQVADESILCLSLDFSHRLQPTSQPQIITSLSNGSLAHLNPTAAGWEVGETWHAHDYEPWTVGWDNWQTSTVWSGGDDLCLKSWDIREPNSPDYTNKRFDAGVTTITSSPYTENLLLVGSYDSVLRAFDSRFPSKPLEEIQCEGGIWRTRFHPDRSRKNDVLVACMHNGFKVVRLGTEIEAGLEIRNGSDQPMDFSLGGKKPEPSEIVKRFDEHKSLAYGADWSRLKPISERGETLVATCSFYDHTLHLWNA